MRFSVELRRSEKRSEYPESSVGAFVRWIFSGGSTKTKSGVTVDQETALKFSVVFSCFRILGETIGSLPLNVYNQNSDGSKSIAFNHPLQRLIKTKPNQVMTSFIWRELIMSHLNGWGNHYSEIIRNGGYKVIGFEPIHPKYLKKIDRTKKGDLLYYFEGREKPIKQENILHFKGISYDGLLGKSPIDIAAENIGLGLSLQNYGSETFANSAALSGHLEYPGKLSKTAYENLYNSWKQKHTGEGKRGGFDILEEGMAWKQDAISPEAAQFISSRQFQIDEICRIFRIPPHLVYELLRSTNNNIEHQGIELVQYTFLPWCVRIEQEFNDKIFTEDEKESGRVYVRFNLNGLLRGDITARTAHYNSMLDRGVYNVNEVRAKEDMNGIGEQGDQYYKQVNTAPVEVINQTQKEETDGNGEEDDTE